MATRTTPRVLAELSAAIQDRASEHQRRKLVPGWRQRIAQREAASLAHIRALRTQARLLIADPATLASTLAALNQVKQSIRRAASYRHRQFDQPAHRPDEKQFRAACQRAMKRHGIGPAAAATIIVRRIAPALPNKARAALLGDWIDEREQIKHLADLLRKRV